MIEADFQDKMVDYLRSIHCYVKPIVASALLSGFPDIMIRNRKGVFFPMEHKVWVNKGPPLEAGDLIKLLDGPQKVTIITEFWRYKALCPLLAFNKCNDGTAWFTLGTNCTKVNWKEFANRIANITHADTI